MIALYFYYNVKVTNDNIKYELNFLFMSDMNHTGKKIHTIKKSKALKLISILKYS